MVSSILLHVTHVDDSVHGRQGPCVYFWGVTHDRSLSLLMETYISTLQKELQSRSPPLQVMELDNQKICCVLINKKWQRARVSEPRLSPLGTLQVFCIDTGETHSIPLSFLRTVDFAGIEADHIRQWPPLASKFILADVVGPRGPGSGSQWSISAMFFLKTHLENRTWKAVPLGNFAGHQGVRLFDSSNQLFVATMVQAEMCVPSQTYQEALSMSKVLNNLANIKLVPEPVLLTPTKAAPSFEYNVRDSPVKSDTPPSLTSTKILPFPFAVDRDKHPLVNRLANMNISSGNLSSNPSPKKTPNPAAGVRLNLLATTNSPKEYSFTSSMKSTLHQPLLAKPILVTEIPDVDLNAEESLFLIFSEKPGSFFGKLEKIPVKDLDEMATELLKFYPSLANPPLLYEDDNSRLGHYGVLEWNEDQNYHRFRRVLVVDEMSDDVIEVYFIDFGNTLKISRFKVLAPLDCLTHFRQPPHGINCKLDENVSFSALEWKNCILDKWVKVKVGKCVGAIYSVSFTNDPINNELPSVLLRNSSSQSTNIEIDEMPDMNSNSFPLTPTAVPKVPPPSMVLENQTMGNAPSKFAPQNMDFVPRQTISTCAVAPFVISLSEIWIQLDPPSVGLIMERIDKFITDPRFVSQKGFPAAIGKPCLAFFPVDGFWYRAVVEAFEGESVTVRYVDYGNTSILQVSYLRELPIDLVKLPALAFKCCLDGADTFYRDFAIAFESRLVVLSAFTVHYLKNVDGILHVHLSSSDGVCLGSLVQRQLIVFPLSHAPQNVNFAPEQIVSACALASHVNSLTEFWVQLEPKTVNSIMGRLDSLGLHPDFINQKNFVASVGKPCLAFYRDADDFFPDDGRWYRAVIERVDGDTARVYCFDYGHTFEVGISLLRNLPSDYAKQPALAFKCCLDGVKALSSAAADAFIDRFVKRSFFCVKFFKVVDGVLHVRLYTKGGVDLFEKHCKKLTPPSSPETKANANDFSTPFAFLLNTPPH